MKREGSVGFRPVRLCDLELAQTLPEPPDTSGYGSVRALVRLHGTPIGWVDSPVRDYGVRPPDLAARAVNVHCVALEKELLRRALGEPPPATGRPQPSVTVAVCTRDRLDELRRCLAAIARVRYPDLDVLVVDNAPQGEASEEIVRSDFPRFRYVLEPRPGLDWARNRALLEARGEILAYTDDDVVVDPGWVAALAAVFAESEGVGAVTGLVAPHELETEAQLLFENFGGFGRGFERTWTRVDAAAGERVARRYGATGKFGTGANMAFRRGALLALGGFDPALDVGTVTRGGGDLEMFFRMLKGGYTLVREPRALVWHRHRAEYGGLRVQLRTWGVGMYSYVVRSCLAFPDEVPGFFWIAVRWLGLRNARRLLWTLFHDRYPRELLVDEFRGAPLAPVRYREARRAAENIAAEFGPLPLPAPRPAPERTPPGRRSKQRLRLELDGELPSLAPTAEVFQVEARWRGTALGSFRIRPRGAEIPPAQLRDAVVDHLHEPLADALGSARLAAHAGPDDGILRRLLFPRVEPAAEIAAATGNVAWGT